MSNMIQPLYKRQAKNNNFRAQFNWVTNRPQIRSEFDNLKFVIQQNINVAIYSWLDLKVIRDAIKLVHKRKKPGKNYVILSVNDLVELADELTLNCKNLEVASFVGLILAPKPSVESIHAIKVRQDGDGARRMSCL